MKKMLEGRRAIVTGASRTRGIGLATVRMFAEEGCRVALLDLDGDEAKTAAASIPGDVIGVQCNVTDAASCAKAVEQVTNAWGGVDILVNNAGVTQRKKVAEITAEDYHLVTSVVLHGTILMSQAALPHMPRHSHSSIIAIGSLSALQGGGIFGGPHYCAAKAGVLGFMRAMAKELGPEGIRVNAVNPGLTLTDFSRGANPDENKHAAAKSYPLGRVGQPSDIASACLFLASDMSSYVTGITIDVNGGSYIR